MPPEGGSPAPRSLILLRHGETDWNRERRIMGDLDIPLNETGREQSRRTGALLRELPIDRLVSSPMLRATETASIVGEALGLETTLDADLAEVRFGSWQGSTYDEIMDDPEYDAYRIDPIHHKTPGGESIIDVQTRARAAFERAEAGACTLFVSHGDIIRSALAHFLAIPLEKFRRLRVDNCSVSAFGVIGDQVEVKFVNLLADADRAWSELHWNRPR